MPFPMPILRNNEIFLMQDSTLKGLKEFVGLCKGLKPDFQVTSPTKNRISKREMLFINGFKSPLYFTYYVYSCLKSHIVSAISGGITDISFHAVGYAWQLANCFLTASYSLMLRRIMDTAKQVTKSGNLNEFSMVLLNNTLSLPLGLLLIAVFNEVDYLSTTDAKSSLHNLVTTFKDSHLLVGDDAKWIFGPSNQLHFNVVSSSNRGHYIQVWWQECFLQEQKCGKDLHLNIAINRFVSAHTGCALTTNIPCGFSGSDVKYFASPKTKKH
ncbi:hypothetical protein HYC85_017197 [Camellia sinensis]|uniref:Uncharacterized protein n=1 Tax=Camellia sinensis TaxID=4442 RepID=A0A7J7H1V3_CAMSI|nr:hypothetical protein HYC85_017197 [Camellia sinensis]